MRTLFREGMIRVISRNIPLIMFYIKIPFLLMVYCVLFAGVGSLSKGLECLESCRRTLKMFLNSCTPDLGIPDADAPKR